MELNHDLVTLCDPPPTPRLGSATAVVLDTAGLCSRLPYSVPLLCSPGGNNLLQGRTAQGETHQV